MTAKPRSRATRQRRREHRARQRAYLDLIATELPAINLPKDTLLNLGAGLALDAADARYEFTRTIAETVYAIPGDTLDTITAAALSTMYPTIGIGVMLRPTDTELEAVRDALAKYGLQVDIHAPINGRPSDTYS